MDSIDSNLAERIRNDIIHGVYAEGERLSEAHLCAAHGVSRTPVRLALCILEREGVIARGEGRGYTIQTPTIPDIKQAVQVRGHLESLGARLLAMQADRADSLQDMERAIDTMDAMIDSGRLDEPNIRQMQAGNELFHTTILKNCGNQYVGYACKQLSHLPMLTTGTMVFDRAILQSDEQMQRGLFRLRIGNAQHKVIYDAVRKGDPVRAQNMMIEHAHTMLEYIETFEKRGGNLTVSDLVAYSAVDFAMTPN